jgi:hypothetical protein
MSIVTKRSNSLELFYGNELVDIFNNMMELAEANYYSVLNVGSRRDKLLDFVKLVERYIDTEEILDNQSDNEFRGDIEDIHTYKYDDDWFY